MDQMRPMDLPNYFLADLPPEAVISPAMITEACQTLKRNRAQYLAGRTTEDLIEVLDRIGASWRRPDYGLRRFALEHGPAALRFSRQTLERGLDDFFSELTAENLKALVIQEVGHPQRLDGMAATASERARNRSASARGPALVAHITAGNIPNPALASMIFSLLARSAQFVKCGRGTSLLPRLFAHSIYEADSKLAACIELAEWPGGSVDFESALFAEAGCVTATGTDSTLDAIRQRLPVGTRFIAHGHRVSFGFIASPSATGATARRIARDAAADIAAWDQHGCLSPHVIYVEKNGAVAPEQFAALLAEELARQEIEMPRGNLELAESTTITLKRDFYRVRAAVCGDSGTEPETKLWCSEGSTAWTVVYEDDPLFHVSCLNRFIHVKCAANLADALHHAALFEGKVSTVALAAPEEQARELAITLSRWGVTRICPFGRMQRPPLGWRHDGQPPLAGLLTWTDWERSEDI